MNVVFVRRSGMELAGSLIPSAGSSYCILTYSIEVLVVLASPKSTIIIFFNLSLLILVNLDVSSALMIAECIRPSEIRLYFYTSMCRLRQSDILYDTLLKFTIWSKNYVR